MAATMRDVSRLAGVSIKTVSNVVNGHPHVSEATRGAVLAAIASLDYQVNLTARNLRTGRTDTIALAVPELRLPYFGELADAVIEAARTRGLMVVIEQHGGDRSREIEVLSGARRQVTDGLIFSPVALGAGDEALLDVDFPIVLLGERVFSDRVNHITMHNVAAARAGTQYLLGLGRRRIAVIGVHPGEVVGSGGLRLSGYCSALEAAGIPVDPRLLGEVGPWHRAAGARAMARLLDSGARPDAVFGFNDALALGAMHELQVRGIRVPQDVAVLGFDDIDEGRYSFPTLSTIDPGREEIATTAVDVIAAQLKQTRRGRMAELVFADYRVVARGSTEPSAHLASPQDAVPIDLGAL